MATDIRTLSLAARSFLVAAILLFDAFAVARVVPVNSELVVNHQHEFGDHDRRVYRIYAMASDQAEEPFWEMEDHFLFQARNGALFLFVAEMFVRLGADTVLPNQLFCLLLQNLALLFFFLWIRSATGSELFAGAALAFLLTTPFLLYHSVSIHHDPYTFLFFNLTMYVFSVYLATKRYRWLALTCLCYFVLCNNYWMYYVSAYLMFVALQHKARRFRPFAMMWLGVVPVVAAAGIFFQMTLVHNGADAAWEHLRSKGEERSRLSAHLHGDDIIPTRSMGDNEAIMREYHTVVEGRIELATGLPFVVFPLLLLGALVLGFRHAWRQHGWLIWVVLAGLSWNILMIQHTAVHYFAGNYGFFLWAVVVATFCKELYTTFRPERAKLVFAAFAAPVMAFMLVNPYFDNLRIYVQNIFD